MSGLDHIISVEKLIALLQQLPPDSLIAPNEVRNLAIANPEKEYIGYIDLLSDEVEMFEDEKETD